MRISGWWNTYSALRGELDLIDELATDQVVEDRVMPSGGEQVRG